MGVYGGPNVSESGLVLALDGANYKSFKGEPTTNLTRNSRDFSGTAYASDDEWVSSEPTRLTKTYISSIVTPIGNGATLIQESGSNGYHHLSRWGGTDESGALSLSCYVFPLTSDITDFVIGMLGDSNNQISFNLNTRAITYGPGISNRDAFITPVVGFDGWYRVGANIEGRGGGWVGCIGYTTSAAYTGTSGNKKCYITGIQYEFKTTPTMFTEAQTTRGTTVATGGGWADLSGTGNNGTLVNGVRESSDNLGSLLFDGTNDYVSVGVANNPTQQITLESWINPNRIPSTGTIRGGAISGDPNHYLGILDSIDGGATHSLHFALQTSSGRPGSVVGNIPRNVWSHIVGTYDGARMKAYLNGVMVYDVALTGTISGSGNWVIGCYQPAPTDGTHNFDGKISNAKIYNRALTAAEVRQNFNAIRSRYGI